MTDSGHLLPVGANKGVAAVETGGKQGSSGALHFIFESVHNTKNPTPEGVGFFVAVLNLMYIFNCVLVTVKPKRLRVTIAYGVLHL